MTLNGFAYHCSRLLQEHWLHFGCPDSAVVVYELPDGSRRAYCGKHAPEGRAEALRRGGFECVEGVAA